MNHPSNAPIHFAFPEFQTDPNGTTRPTDYGRDITKCSICKTWKFPQEMGRKKWCCKGGNLIDVITPWTQRNLRTIFDISVLTRLDRRRSSGSNAANLTTKSVSPHMALPTPSFIKISGHICSRLLNADSEDDGTLRYYVHDATYRRNKKLRLETLLTDRAAHGLLAARWSFRSCLALHLWRSRFG